jgi:hypothetical protein
MRSKPRLLNWGRYIYLTEVVGDLKSAFAFNHLWTLPYSALLLSVLKSLSLCLSLSSFVSTEKSLSLFFCQYWKVSLSVSLSLLLSVLKSPPPPPPPPQQGGGGGGGGGGGVVGLKKSSFFFFFLKPPPPPPPPNMVHGGEAATLGFLGFWN